MFRIILVVLLSSLSGVAFAHGMSAEDQARILNAGYWEYVQLGATHMLSGYDHLLFLFGVIFFLTRFSDILKFITAFTIGHSITLVFATLLEINANYYLIDAVIALTVCYKAFDNLDGFKRFFQMPSPNLTWMVFGFGLIHGFGLSTRLQQLPLGTDNLVLKILSFNVGVELGQIIALSIMLIILAGWRKTASFTRFSKASNIGLMLLGGLLLLMQLHGYQHTQYPDDFPLNADDHSHIHEDMEAQSSPLTAYPVKFNSKADSSQDKEVQDDALPSDTHSHNGESSHSH
ncbi:HupE/UreJ family protein [Dasania marina]|uniref:HupE/UreJ family protein n=1 Tax=Dasania marina TaxID=471499 RepID=UPI0003762C7C|nr:HupE/UreJ family protein [Dasania marina]